MLVKISIDTKDMRLLIVSPVAVIMYFWLYLIWPFSEAAAASVQAVFSVIAIWAAWYIPYRHELRREERQRQDVLETIGALAARQGILHKRLLDSLEGGDALQSWQLDNGVARWRTHYEILNGFPVGSLIGFDISYLIVMREAADFGLRLATEIIRWNPYAMPRFDIEEDPANLAEWHMKQVAGVGAVVLSGVDQT